ncbi:2Fe-2S iron-sulfur cluster-binding protein [Streptacidiphilus monticola]|uniref:2Fe-2S iron-sulfur cluster-binding protein n=1 Tax=Streptacidiphilus monticola TaxID=2161674 RepID=A0ABW1GBM3_9ACTN
MGTESTTSEVRLVVNGQEVRLRVDNRRSLLDLLRDDLALTGSKKGCDHGQCGACTVLLDGRRVVACLVLAATADGSSVTTVEGLAGHGAPHRLQSAFTAHDGFQCGFCTPGQLCSAVGMLGEVARGRPSFVTDPRHEGPIELTEAEIRERMSGNLCRCGAYDGIVAAIREVAG